MADISKIILPNGDEYDLKDYEARQELEFKADLVTEVEEGYNINFDNPLKSGPISDFRVTIKPNQNLHGMDRPYAANSGVSSNLIPDTKNTANGYINGKYINNAGVVTTGPTSYTSEYFPVTAGATYTWDVYPSSYRTTPNAGCIWFYDSSYEPISYIQALKTFPKTFEAPEGACYCRSVQTNYTDGISGPEYYFHHIALGSTIDTPRLYSNLCPISGYTTGGFYVRGKNLVNPIAANFLTTNAGRSILYDDGSVELKSSSVTCGFICPVSPNTQYRASWYKHDPYSIYIQAYEFSSRPTAVSTSAAGFIRNAISVQSKNTVSEVYCSGTFTTTPRTKYVIVVLYRSGTISGAIHVDQFMLELGATKTDFAEFNSNSQSYNPDWSSVAGTIYDGTADAITGDVVSKWGYIASYNGESLPGEWISDRDVYAEGTVPSTGAEVCYELAEPLEYNIGTHQLNTLLGINNIYSDIGESYIETLKGLQYYYPRIGGEIGGSVIPVLNDTYSLGSSAKKWDALYVTPNGLGAFSNKSAAEGAVAIPSGSNLNSYRTPGTYYSPNATTSASLTNAPIDTSGFKLFVEGSYVKDYLKQYLIGGGSNTHIYVRTSTSTSAWGAWTYLYTEADGELLSTEDKTALDGLITNVGNHTIATDVPANAHFMEVSSTQPVNQTTGDYWFVLEENITSDYQ